MKPGMKSFVIKSIQLDEMKTYNTESRLMVQDAYFIQIAVLEKQLDERGISKGMYDLRMKECRDERDSLLLFEIKDNDAALEFRSNARAKLVAAVRIGTMENESDLVNDSISGTNIGRLRFRRIFTALGERKKMK
jgi:hypothetical protein